VMEITAPVEHLEAMLSILSELVREPSFVDREVQSAKTRTLAQLANDLDDPELLADRALVRAFWGNHPYGHDVSGEPDAVKSFNREDVARFHRERYGPRVSFLSVVGAVDPAQAKKAVEAVFGSWAGGPEKPVEIPVLPAPEKAGRVVLVDKPDQTQSQVRIAGMGMPMNHPDLVASATLNAVVGAGFTSRLVDEIRVNRGLSYGVSSYFERLKTGGVFAVSTFTKTETTKEILDVAMKELGKVRKAGITPAELKRAQTYIAGLYPFRTETNEAVGALLTDIRIDGLPENHVETYRERVLATTSKEMKDVAARYLFPQPPVVVVVGNAAKVKTQVAGYGPVEVVKLSEAQ
jgi:zinc protease